MHKKSFWVSIFLGVFLMVSVLAAPVALGQMYPGPMITLVEPNRVERGKTVEIKILGDYFALGAKISIGNLTIESLKVIPHKEIDLTVAIAEDMPLGQLDVTVTNPDGQSDTLKGGFTVVEAVTPIHEPEVTAAMGKVQEKLEKLEEDLEEKKKENAEIIIWIEQWISWGWLLGFLWWIPWILVGLQWRRYKCWCFRPWLWWIPWMWWIPWVWFGWARRPCWGWWLTPWMLWILFWIVVFKHCYCKLKRI